MAAADYYHCDNCGRRCFYDAELQWTTDENGRETIAMCGDIKALCMGCAKTHECVVIEKEDNKYRYGTTGWICPVCGRGNSPSLSICPCKPIPQMEITY